MAKARKTFWVVDCETDPFKPGRVPRPFIWGAYEGDSEQYEEFATVDELVRFFREKRTTVYAHNGGKFDYHYLRDEINSDESVLVINGRLARFRIGVCEFRDSLNIFPNTRLKDFGVKREIDYALMEPERRSDPNVMAEIRLYLRDDCVGLWTQVRRYWDDYGKSLTQAGASMKYWERMSGIKAPRQTKAAHAEYRPYYYGGRVQCFEAGVRACNFQVADINSAYPFAMLRNHMFSTEGVEQDHLPPEPQIYQCLVTLDGISRGALPWRGEDDELYFPDDEAGNRNRVRTYNVTGWELLTALELDALKVTRIRKVFRFLSTVNFTQYIEHFFKLREDARKRGDIAGRIFAKYFMNSLYGKFGANPEKYREFVIASDDSVAGWELRGYQRYKTWGARWLMTRPIPEDKERYYNVATAASVTGFVRAYLFRAIHACEGVIYCDTDSIAARDVSRLTLGTELGAWKHEMDCDRYAIAGKKLYAFHKAGASVAYDPEAKDKNWKVASKGVNFTNRADGPELVTRIAAGETIRFDPDVPCYSITRETPRFINREVMNTFKDMSLAPEYVAA